MYSKILLISPHPDDIALSLGCTVMRYMEKYKFYIWDVFTTKKYNKLSLDFNSATQRIQQEEYDVWKHSEVELLYDDFEDAQIRFKSRIGQLLGDAVTEHDILQRDEELVCKLRVRYNNLINLINPDYVGVPLGIGKHIDHLIIRHVALSFSKSKLFFYEDMPYSINRKWYEKAIKSAHNMLIIKKNKISFSNEQLQYKLKMLTKYKSQLAGRDLRHIANYYNSECGMFENIWTVVETWRDDIFTDIERRVDHDKEPFI